MVSVTSTRFCLGSHSRHRYSGPMVSSTYLAVFSFSGAGLRAAAVAVAAAVSAAVGPAVRGTFIAVGASLRYLERSPSTISSARCLVSREKGMAGLVAAEAAGLFWELAEAVLASLTAWKRCSASRSEKVPSLRYLP